MTTTKALFETKDINLAAYLKGIKKYDIIDIVELNGRVVFCFKDLVQRKKDVLNFYNDDGEHLSYVNAWKDLKNMLHNVKKDE